MTSREFEILARSLTPRLRAEARRIVASDMDADDVVQDTMLKLWSLRSELDTMRSVDAFAVVVVRRQAINALRQLHPDRHVALGENIEGDLSPEDQLIEQQRRNTADAVMAQLPDSQQTLLRLRHVEGYDNASIAALPGTSEGAVRTALSRARRHVAQIFQQQYTL